MQEPILTDVNEQGTVAVVSIPVAGSGTDATSNRAVSYLRDEILLNTVGLVPAIEEYGSRGTRRARRISTTLHELADHLGVGFVIGLAFLLLLVTFRSLVIPIKAIILNLLSKGGLRCADHRLPARSRQEHPRLLVHGGRCRVHMMFLFVILFGLSMDYHVSSSSAVSERAMTTGSRPSKRSRTASR